MAGAFMQVRFPTDLTDEEYVNQRVWNDATRPQCPWCKAGSCQLIGNGTYPRVKPHGTQVKRFRCRRTGRTVSLLPDCFATRVKGTLEEIEEVVRAIEQAPSRSAAAAWLRPPEEVGEAGALRWLRRRVRWVQAVLVLVKGLIPERFVGVRCL